MSASFTKKDTLLFFLFLFCCTILFAQKNTSFKASDYKTKWTTNPFDQKIFIENNGQFDQGKSDQIKYGFQLGKAFAYLTPGGVIYKYEETGEEGKDPDKKDPDASGPVNKKNEFISATWLGSNPNVRIEALQKENYFCSYPLESNKTIKAGVYKKLIYHDLYPGIDAEYVFPEGKEGIKYNLVVHPGADLSLVKLKYTGAEKVKLNRHGEVTISGELANLMDHKPLSYYEDNSGNVTVVFNLTGSVESFAVQGEYDKNKTLIVDPWTTDPLFGFWDNAYDINCDYNGNVYAYGSTPEKLTKLDNTGAIKWQFNASAIWPGGYGDFALNKKTGTSYLIQGVGGQALKVDAGGNLLATFPGNPLVQTEMWRAIYNQCNDSIIVAGGKNTGNVQAYLLDTNMTSSTSLNPLGAPLGNAGHDMALLALDPNGTYCYMATAKSANDPANFDNVLIRMPASSLAPTNYMVPDGYAFSELSVVYDAANGMNGMVASANWLYMYDGAVLKKVNKTTGAIVSSVTVTGTSFKWAGLDVDRCENIYAGNQSSISVYDAGLGLKSTIPLSNTVYDLQLSYDSHTIYACGKNFVSAVEIYPRPDTIIKSKTPATCTCNGTATATLVLCGSPVTAGVTYSWSNGATTQSISNLCAGIYSVTITPPPAPASCGAPSIIYHDTIHIGISNALSGLTFVKDSTNVTCSGAHNGTASVTASGGTSPYSYLWSPSGGTTSSVTALAPGTYTCTITDSGCHVGSAVITITEPAPVVIAIKDRNNVRCNGGNTGMVSVGVTGGTSPYSYSWSNGSTNFFINQLPAGNYTLKVTDALACTGTLLVSLTEPSAVQLKGSAVDAGCHGACNGNAGIASVSGGTSPYVYSWSIAGTDATVSALCAGSYTATISDFHLCKHDTVFVISEPPAFTFIKNSNTAFCGASNGSASAAISGGTSPYSYSWNNGNTTSGISNVSAGTYTLHVTDSKGCRDSILITVPGGGGFTYIPSAKNVSCFAGADGSASVASNGGITPYTYSWSNGQTLSTASGLTVGTYTCVIHDNSGGCNDTIKIKITQPQPFSFNKNIISASCGASDGSASLTVTGGTTPYLYSWNTGATKNSSSGLAHGSYTMHVTDVNGCKDSTVAVVPGGSVFTDISTAVNVLCNGGNNGTISISTAGGITPYAYSWSNGQTTSSVSNLSVGTYTCVITDNSGGNCNDTLKINLTEPPKLQLKASVSGVNCYKACDGSGNVIATGGVQPYSYSWSNTATTSSISALCAANYTVTLTDKNLCHHDTIVVITEPTALKFAPSFTSAACGKSNGSASVIVTGGTGPYAYSWNTGATVSAISNIAKGSYTLTARDVKGCKDSVVIAVPGGSAFTDTPAFNNVLCFGGNSGSASVTMNGGTPPYSYRWSSGATVASVTGLIAGTYTCTVNDNSYSCPDTLKIKITEPAKLILAATSSDAACFSSCNGKAGVVASGGTQGYTYLWGNNATNGSISALCAGIYSVTITDKNSCKHDTSIVIHEPTAISFTKNTTATTCGKANGTATVNVTGGTTAYIYLWNNGTTASGLSNVTSGSYTLSVTDANNCVDTVSVVVPAIKPFSVTGTSSKVLCFGDANASADVTVVGNSSPYAYSWSNGQTTNPANNLGAGIYSVIVTDKSGCTSVISDTVTQPSPLMIEPVAKKIICMGQSVTLNANASGGTGPYSYVWDNSTSSAGYTVSAAASKTYKVVATDANGCKTNQTDSVVVNPTPQAVFSGKDVCLGISTLFKDSSYAAGGTGFASTWNFGDGTSSDSPKHTYTTSGTYTVSLTVSAGPCQTTIKHVVNVYPAPTADFVVNPESMTVLNPVVTFTDLSQGGTKGLWTFGDNTDSVYVPGINPVHHYPNENIDQRELFHVLLEIQNQFGCKDTISKIISIDPEFTFYAPNTFTPNGDGKNDLFFGTGTGIIEKEMWIFDRWGNQIFHTNDLYGGWDGKVQGGGSNEVAQQDTYVWLIQVKDVFLKTHRIIGHVNIIK